LKGKTKGISQEVFFCKKKMVKGFREQLKMRLKTTKKSERLCKGWLNGVKKGNSPMKDFNQ